MNQKSMKNLNKNKSLKYKQYKQYQKDNGVMNGMIYDSNNKNNSGQNSNDITDNDNGYEQNNDK